MRQRQFMSLLGGAAAAYPFAARAQQSERVRRVGVLMSTTENDVEGQARIGAFLQGLRQSGWAVPGNVRIETRWGGGDAERIRKYAAEFVRSRRTSSWRVAARSRGRCCRRRARCRSSSR